MKNIFEFMKKYKVSRQELQIVHYMLEGNETIKTLAEKMNLSKTSVVSLVHRLQFKLVVDCTETNMRTGKKYEVKDEIINEFNLKL